MSEADECRRRCRATRPRIDVRKTYKLYVGGAFPRSESGRSYPVTSADGTLLAHAAQASRKDARDAVVAARGAFARLVRRRPRTTAARSCTASPRCSRAGASSSPPRSSPPRAAPPGQRARAGRRRRSTAGCTTPGGPTSTPRSSARPTRSPARTSRSRCPNRPASSPCSRPRTRPCSGWSRCSRRSSPPATRPSSSRAQDAPLPAISLAEVLATSDLPGGVVNLLTGVTAELAPWLASHRDVNAIDLTGAAAGDPRRAADRGGRQRQARLRAALDRLDGRPRPDPAHRVRRDQDRLAPDRRLRLRSRRPRRDLVATVDRGSIELLPPVPVGVRPGTTGVLAAPRRCGSSPTSRPWPTFGRRADCRCAGNRRAGRSHKPVALARRR